MTSTITKKNRKWWVLAAMTCSISVIYLDQSVLPVALPTIQRELGLSELALQWTINIYLLVLTAFVLAGGRVGDMLGHRKIFTLGLLLFAIASAFCGLSENEAMFITSRGFQGLGGAMMIPTGPALLTPAFPAEQRGKVFGLYVSIGAFFLALGPLVGGFLTQYLSWRFVFWINLPITAIALLLTFYSVPKSDENRRETFDFLGFFTLLLGVSGVVTALMQGQYWGWASWPVLTLGIGGVALIAALIIFDREVKHPFIDFSLFKKRNYTTGTLCIFFTQFILMLTVFWAIYFQKILGYSPSVAGVWSMIASSPVIVVGALSGHLFDRYGAKLPIVLGFILVSIAIAWFTFVPTPTSAWMLLPVVLPFGCGIPLIIIPSFTLYLNGLEVKKRGVAVGINSTLRQLGATIGIAIFGSFFVFQQDHKFGQLMAMRPDTSHLNPEPFEGLLSQTPASLSAIASLPPDVAAHVQKSFYTSTVFASTRLNILGLSITVVSLILALIFIRWGRHPHAAKEEK